MDLPVANVYKCESIAKLVNSEKIVGEIGEIGEVIGEVLCKNDTKFKIITLKEKIKKRNEKIEECKRIKKETQLKLRSLHEKQKNVFLIAFEKWLNSNEFIDELVLSKLNTEIYKVELDEKDFIIPDFFFDRTKLIKNCMGVYSYVTSNDDLKMRRAHKLDVNYPTLYDFHTILKKYLKHQDLYVYLDKRKQRANQRYNSSSIRYQGFIYQTKPPIPDSIKKTIIISLYEISEISEEIQEQISEISEEIQEQQKEEKRRKELREEKNRKKAQEFGKQEQKKRERRRKRM